MKILIAWTALVSASLAMAGEEVSVLKNPPAKADCTKCETNCCPTVYSERTDERSTCRKTVFGKVVRRDVRRTTLTPVR